MASASPVNEAENLQPELLVWHNLYRDSFLCAMAILVTCRSESLPQPSCNESDAARSQLLYQ